MSQPPDDRDEPAHDATDTPARAEDDPLDLRGTTHHDESLADQVLERSHGTHHPRRRRRRNPVLKTLALLAAAAVVLVAGYYSFGAVRTFLPDLAIGADSGGEDYKGSGSGEVLVEIPGGTAGGQISELLVQDGVVASVSAFDAALAAEPRSDLIQPGTYRMANEMSAQAALARLLDASFREDDGVTIREGLWVGETFALLADATGHDVADYEAVDPATLDLPAAAEGELEGFLYPSTYEFPPDATPQQQLALMVDTGRRTYTELGLEDGPQLRDTIIKASIVQGEGMLAEDLPKIARVMENRLEEDAGTNGYLQMDSTVHFVEQERGRAGTTEEQRSNPDPYNTYAHPGLPPGPINSPGEDAIRAAMDPTPGDWTYFVTVDPSTGETKFASTFEEHEDNVAEFQQWCRANPDQC